MGNIHEKIEEFEDIFTKDWGDDEMSDLDYGSYEEPKGMDWSDVEQDAMWQELEKQIEIAIKLNEEDNKAQTDIHRFEDDGGTKELHGKLNKFVSHHGHEIVTSSADGKHFKYCRTCKDEVYE